MPAPVQTSRSQWIDAGLAALAAGGPSAVRVEVLAASLGVTKGGFYGQFADRAAFLTALLDEWERRSVDDVLAEVERAGGDTPERILRAGRLTFADELLPIDLAVRAWARTDADVTARLRRVDDARLSYLRSQFEAITTDADDVEARTFLAFTLAIGQHFMAATHGGRAREDATANAFALLVRA